MSCVCITGQSEIHEYTCIYEYNCACSLPQRLKFKCEKSILYVHFKIRIVIGQVKWKIGVELLDTEGNCKGLKLLEPSNPKAKKSCKYLKKDQTSDNCEKDNSCM